MQCQLHPESDAIGACTSCGRAICKECAVEVQGRLVCRGCLASGNATTRKDPNTAFLIEMLAGFFGFLGVGYLYAGRTSDGVLRLVLWLIYDVVAAIAISLLLAVIVGFVCIPIQLIIQIGVPLWSANNLKKQMLGGTSSVATPTS